LLVTLLLLTSLLFLLDPLLSLASLSLAAAAVYSLVGALSVAGVLPVAGVLAITGFHALFACILPITTPANGGVGVVLASLLLRYFSCWSLLSLVPLLLLASYPAPIRITASIRLML
jgi:hypothetical protein